VRASDRPAAGERPATLAALRRADGGTVIIGRDMAEVLVLHQVIRRGLVLGIVPTAPRYIQWYKNTVV